MQAQNPRNPDGTDHRDRLAQRWTSLKSERDSWMSHWEEISTYLLPRSGRFMSGEKNDGRRKHNSIYDSTGTRALNVLAAGMMAGMTSPARPWFRLTTPNLDLAEYAPVKLWLSEVTRLMLSVFARSNTYRSLHTMYMELGAFGTAASIVLPDFTDVKRHYPLTIGEYCISADYRGQVNTLYREVPKRVSELVGEFGYSNCSQSVRNMYDRGALDQWITIVHAIEPRSDRDHRKQDAKNMPWSSCYFELGADKGKYLRESGFKRFPALAPRWSISGGDLYGSAPGMEALGDLKQLQHEQLRKAEGIDYKTRPPLQVPISMKGRDVDRLPGGITYVDQSNPTGGIRSAFNVDIDLNHLLADIQDVRERIKGSFYADLFLMLANQTDARMTATEVAERHEEKLLMLGPVMERLHNEMLDPLIEMTFDLMLEAGVIPTPPKELQGQNLNVEFVSMLAQAQRAIGTNSIDRFVNSLGAVASISPGVLDNFDSDKWTTIYADALGVDPQLIVASDKVAMVRQARAEAAVAQEQAAMAQQNADTAATLASVKTNEPNALTDATRAFSGYT